MDEDRVQLGVNMHQLLKLMVEKGASDLHITVGSPPQLRIDGTLVPLKLPKLGSRESRALCYSVLTDAQKASFEEHSELDFSFGIRGLSRFRGNVFMQRAAVGGVFRLIPFEIRSFDDLNLPPVVRQMSERPRGLVLVTGPTGSGKSTTLAAIIDSINSSRRQHIITIEDPIEYLHEHKNCLVNQREVGSDTAGFKQALRYILRQDPDVVLLGEMRDLETIEAALTIAETGHLVFATLHTNSCAQTVNRIIDVFPPHQQEQVRAQLSFVIEGICCQQLVPKATGSGRAMALEVLVPTPAIRNLIREDKIHQIYSQMQVGQKQFGMVTLNQSLLNLYVKRIITLEEAMMRCSDVAEFRSMLQSAGVSVR
ncbi:MAG: type IV pilus twitching motility protein PilT [Myxococcota bacterium]|jgi:twitching motility protein PilT|nr:type IV pilus twitching motility protein PilT [Myxococcota bacterium]